jgi:hypothetical protein
MFRLLPKPLLLIGLAVAMTGCHVMYRDVYSPKRNHYVVVKEKEKVPILPEEKIPASSITPQVVPGGGLPVLPGAAPAAGAAPAIPGLDPVPPPPAGATPPAQ